MHRTAFAVALMLGVAVPLSAQPPVDWNNPAGGLFATPGNWTPAGPPGSGALARFNLPNTYTVTFGGTVTNTRFAVNQGNVTWALGGFTYNITGIPNDIGVGGVPASLDVQSGTVNAAGLSIGNLAGASGSFIVDSSSTFNVTGSILSVGGGGTGTVVVQNAGQFSSGQSYIGGSIGGSGSVTVTGSGSKWTLSDFLRVGDAGSGTLTVSSGGVVNATSLAVAQQANSGGTLTVTGGGSTVTTSSSLTIALGGSGTMNVVAGGKVTANTFNLGGFQGTLAAATVSGGGSSLTVNNGATLGGFSNSTPASSAVLVVGAGGTVNFNGATTLQSTAIVNINGGTLNLGTINEQPGAALNWTTGTVRFADGGSITGPLLNQLLAGTNTVAAGQTLAATGGTMTLGSPLVVAGNGAINPSALTTTASFTINTFGAVSATDTVTLGTGAVTQISDLGTLSATNGVTNNGTLQLNGPSAAIHAFVANLGTLQGTGRLNNGLSNTTIGTIRARAGDDLVVDGVGPTNLGNIELSGGTIEFTKTLSNLGNGFISGRGEFRGSTASPGGIGLSNSGVMAFSGGTTDIRGDVQNNSGGHIVNAGGGVLTFYDDVVHNGAEIRTNAGSRTVFFGAQSGAGPFTGTGVIEYNGDLRPGNSPARVTYEGDVILNSSAKFYAELGGTAVGSQYDQLSIQGSVTVGGNLQLQFIDGFVPQPGQSFDLIEDRGPSPISGIFMGLSEGQTFTTGGETFQATYLGGGTGHDFVVSVMPVPEPRALALGGLAAVGWVTFWGRRWREAAAVVGLACLAGPTMGQTWSGPGTDWNTAANWNPATVPNSATAVVNFNGGALGTINISSNVQAQSLNFGISNGSFTITANAGQVLNSLTTINVAANVNSEQSISLPSFASGDLLFASSGNLAINNNSPAAGTTLFIGPTTVGTPGSGGIVFNGPGNSQFTGGFATGSNGVVGGLTKNGPGTLSFFGDGSNLRGGLTVTGGTLSLDYSSNTAVKLGSSGSLTLGGGLLALVANNSTSVTQNIPSGTIISAGHTDIQATSGGGGTLTLNLNGLTRSVGGTVDISTGSGSPSFSVNTTANSSNALILGPGFLTMNNGATWGTLSATTISPFSSYSTNVFNQSFTNTDVTQSSLQSNISDNSLRFNAPNVTLTLTGTNTIQSGGVLVTNNAFGSVINGGTLTPTAPNEVIFHVYGDLVVNSAISSPAGLTKTGPGNLTLGGVNTSLTGPINVNRGFLTVSATAAVNSASQISFNDNRNSAGLQELTVDLGNNVTGAITPPIRLSPFSSTGYGTFFSTGASTGSTVTLQGAISSAPGQTTPIRFTGSSTNSSEFDLNGLNTFTGNISLFQGTLGVSSDQSLGNAANSLALEVGSTTAGGLRFLLANPISHPISLNSATRVICDPGNYMLSGPISGPSLLYKVGNGGLTLSGNNTYAGGTNVTAGTLYVAADSALGTGNVTVGPFGTLLFTGTTATDKSFTLSGGTVSVATNQFVTLNGGQLSGGYLAGSGAFATGLATGAQFANMTTRPAVTLISDSGSDAYINMTNGGAFSVAAGVAFPVNFNGFTNQGSGSVTIGPASKVNATDFQSYGTLTINPATVGGGQFTDLTNAGLAPLYFNGGSRTFLGTPQTANLNGQPTFVAGIDLNGKNAVVAGGLFVNNGFVVDSSNNGLGTATVVADFGSLVKGAGFFQNPIITQNGGRVQAGNSPGSASFGRFVFGPGGVSNYVFAIDDATGGAGPSPDAQGHVRGWGFINAIRRAGGDNPPSTGDFTWTATPTDKLTVAIDTLINPTTVGTDVPGFMAEFDPNHGYSWPAAHWAGTYSGPADAMALNASTSFDTSGFLNPIAGTFGWSLDSAGQTLSLVYTPSSVPEPGTLALVGLAVAGLAWRRRLGRCAK